MIISVIKESNVIIDRYKTIKMLPLIYLFVLTIFPSCANNVENRHPHELTVGLNDSILRLSLDKIKTYEKYHQKTIDSLSTVINIAFSSTSNFYIVKLYNDGFFVYTFWKKNSNSYNFLFKDSIPVVQFESDSTFDVNGDALNDFIVKGQYINGRYQPSYSYVYCYDSINSSFLKIDTIVHIPNPKFVPSKKRIIGEEETDSFKYVYNYIWQDRFNLHAVDTVVYNKGE